jgi:transposase
MGAAASLDLRRRVVEAYRRGEGNYGQIAARFAIGHASVSRWLRRERETGDVAPRPHGGGRTRRISPEQEKLVEGLVQAHPDWTEEEFAKALRDQFGIVASAVTVGRVIRRLGYSVKKRPSSQPSEIGPTCNGDGRSSSKKFETSPLHVWFLWTKPARTSR